VSLWISSEDNQQKCKYLEACMALLNQLKWHSNLSRIRLIPGLILFLHEQRGEQGLLKLQAIHQVKDREKDPYKPVSHVKDFRNMGNSPHENPNSKIQQNFIFFSSIFSKKVAIILFVEN
jgi:hypothetical protein